MAIGEVSDKLFRQMEEWVNEGVIDCPKCGNLIETDCPKCNCGWKNPMILLGMI
jgi:rubrerythrin